MNEAARAIEAIRRTELEAAQRVEQAKTRAEEIVAEAKARAATMIEEGRRLGRESAQTKYEQALAGIEAEAARVRAEGLEAADRLKMSASTQLDELVDEMTEVVLAPPLERGK